MNKKKVELLAPAGNMEKLEMAFHYGADAVFLGGKMFNLRSGSHNFTNEELKKAAEYAHSLGKTVWVTLNIIPHNDEMEPLINYVKYLDSINVDGVIVADLGVFQLVKEHSNLEISISTQASNTNWRSVKLWKDLGAKRVVLARELSLENIAEIRRNVPDIEIEVFVHGAMCMAISGRCLLSNYMTKRDANRGGCAQSCRWKYSIVEETRPGEYMPVYEDEGGTHIFNSKDLCTIEFLDQLLDLGIDSVKIEGRMKGIYYVANVVRIYREAIDSYYNGEFKYDKNWMQELQSISHRKYTSGFYFNKPGEEAQNYDNRNSYSQTHQLVGKVTEKKEDGSYILAVRNQMFKDEELEVIGRYGKPRTVRFAEFALIKGHSEEPVEKANPNSFVRVKLNDSEVEVLDMLRRVITDGELTLNETDESNFAGDGCPID